jgi:hypothetical protein
MRGSKRPSFCLTSAGSLVALVLALMACSRPPKAEPLASAAGQSGAPQPTTDAWQALFDGTSLQHFRGYCRADVPARWRIEDGELHLVGTRDRDRSTGGDLITRDLFGDFELELEWRIATGGNSGVFYRGREACAAPGQEQRPLYESAPEMQVLDNATHPDAQLGKDGNRRAGSLYDLIAARPETVRPAGEWNQVRIQVRSNHVRHELNGTVVVEYDWGTPEWEARCQSSKFKDWPNFVHPAPTGAIGLQDHGDDVWYRAIRIRSL